MDAGTIFGRSMAFPPQVAPDGSVAWSEGEQNIRESIQIILQTKLGERLNLKSFGGGLNRFLFEPNTVATRHGIADTITKALQAWEPRLILSSVQVNPDPNDPQAAIAIISYQLVATQARQQVTLNVTLSA